MPGSTAERGIPMKSPVKIGVMCLARTTFDYHAAKRIFDAKKEELRKIENVQWKIVEDLVIEPEEAEKASKRLAAEDPDGVVLISGTFHLGHLALIANKYLSVPILLWAFNELPYNGGKIRLNSVCGLNLNASNLYKAGNDSFLYHIGDEMDEAWIDALRMHAILRNSHVGIAGYRAHGFFNLDVEDLSVYRRLGILLDHYEIADLFQKAPPESGDTAEKLRHTYDCSGITEAQVRKTGALADSIEEFMQANRLDALAVRCWPEFASVYGVAPCGAMSYLASKGYILGCEGDVEGTLSILAGKAVADRVPFLADLSQVNFEEDCALLWHCGVASPTLWDGECGLSLDTYFAGGKGVTSDFVMKSGEITIFRIDTARGKTRLFLEKGRAVPMEKLLRGTYAKVLFDKPVRDVLDAVLSSGVAHHVAMIYGDHTEALRDFAHMEGFEVLT